MNYIQSVNNPQVKQWRKLLTKKERDITNLFLIEGFHLIEEALQEENRVKQLIVSEDVQLPQQIKNVNIPITIVTANVLKQIIDTKTPQGIVAVCYQTKTDFEITTGQSFVLIDAIQDPGNVGTIIRTADSAGVDAVIVGSGTVDIYHPRVLRAAQGSHFHIPVLRGDLQQWINKFKKHKIPVFGTALQNSLNFEEITNIDSYALIVGNEGSGVAEQLLKQTDKNLHIPIYGKNESLNVAVATGILTYYLQSLLRE